MEKSTLKTEAVGMSVTGLNGETSEPNLIIISKNKIATTYLATWENENSPYYYEDTSNAGTSCVDNVVIDLNKLSTTDGILIRNWLKVNSDYICFEDSFKYIEEVHIITDQSFKDSIDQAANPRDASYDYIKSTATGLIKREFPTKDFENHGYEGYLNFTPFIGNQLDFDYEPGDAKEGRYSIPFLRSIKHRIDTDLNRTIDEKDIKFTFARIQYPSDEVIIAFRVNVSVGTSAFTAYYNFSTDPGKTVTYKSIKKPNSFKFL